MQMRKQRLRMAKQQAPNHQRFCDETEVRSGAFCSLCTCPLQAQVERRWLVTSERETGGPRDAPGTKHLQPLFADARNPFNQRLSHLFHHQKFSKHRT